jgi:hypothetical protein
MNLQSTTTRPRSTQNETIQKQPYPSLNRMRQDRNINTQVYTELEKVEKNTPQVYILYMNWLKEERNRD